MNGCLIKKERVKRNDCWEIALYGGQEKAKRSIFHGTREEANKKLRELLVEHDRGEFVDPSKLTFGDYSDSWLEKVIKPGRASNTYRTFSNAIRLHIKPRLGHILLQKLRPMDIEAFHAATKMSPGTSRIHHTVIRSALKMALRDGLVRRNVASLATTPKIPTQTDRLNFWNEREARAVLEAAKEMDPQTSALLALALDSGARKGELQGLRWTEVDLSAGTMRIERQFLEMVEGKPVFGPTKTRRQRALDLSAETVARLREHKRVQAELKLANRPYYEDYGLVFAHTYDQGGSDPLGAPLGATAIRAILDRLIEAASVKRITVHGLRHTSATLLLAAGVQPHVVQQRLGHAGIGTTLNLYAHVLPSMQQDAASRLGALLYGSTS